MENPWEIKFIPAEEGSEVGTLAARKGSLRPYVKDDVNTRSVNELQLFVQEAKAHAKDQEEPIEPNIKQQILDALNS